MGRLKRIDQYYDSLTVSERRIADYINNNPELAVKLSIHELAAMIGCAPSSITKFVRKLEYKSFSAMRIELVKSVDLDSARDFNEILSWGNSRNSMNDKYIQSIQSICTDTLDINEYDKIVDIARKIVQADKIYLFGVGASSIIAQDLQQKLIKLKKPCMYTMDGNYGAQYATLAKKEDVAIAISYSGHTEEVLLATRRAKESGCPLIAFTRYAKTPLVDLADISLYVPNTEAVARVVSMFSRYAFLFLVDMVFLNVAHLSGQDPEKVLRDYRELRKLN